METLSSVMAGLLGDRRRSPSPLRQDMATTTEELTKDATEESPPAAPTRAAAARAQGPSNTASPRADDSHASPDVARLHREREELREQLESAATLMNGVRQQLGTLQSQCWMFRPSRAKLPKS